MYLWLHLKDLLTAGGGQKALGHVHRLANFLVRSNRVGINNRQKFWCTSENVKVNDTMGIGRSCIKTANGNVAKVVLLVEKRFS